MSSDLVKNAGGNGSNKMACLQTLQETFIQNASILFVVSCIHTSKYCSSSCGNRSFAVVIQQQLLLQLLKWKLGNQKKSVVMCGMHQ